jgi:hypothetical protein
MGDLKNFIFALSLRPSDRHFKADIIRRCDICMGDLKNFIFALSLRPSDRHFKADLIRECDICMGNLSILFSHFPYVSLIGILKLI